MFNKVGNLFVYDFKFEIHPKSFMQKNCSFKQMWYLGFCGIKPFHQPSPFLFRTTNLPLHFHSICNMHFVVGFDNIIVNIMTHFTPPNPLHDEHLFV